MPPHKCYANRQMANAIAPPKSTAGGGFVFEDKACAWFMAHMLGDELPLGAGLGPLERLDFQTRPEGWLLDDMLLTLNGGDGKHRCAISIKSNAQFTQSSAPSDFVRLAWEQFLGEGSSSFDKDSDLMGLITAPLPTEMRESLDFVVTTARDGDPQLLPQKQRDTLWHMWEQNLFLAQA